jgi:integrase
MSSTNNGVRTFTTRYRDTRVRRPDFSLDEAIAWFLADHAHDKEPTTMQTYRSHLTRFSAWLPANERTLASLNPEVAQRYVRETAASRNTAMNKAIALKALAKYLAERKIWFDGGSRMPLSVLRDMKQGRPTEKGQAAYRDDELRAIVRAANDGRYPLRNRAIIAVELHGFRSKEARLMLLRNVALGAHDELGHFIIDDEANTKHGSGGVRVVPMEPLARDAIIDYLRNERPAWRGPGRDEPLFLTRSGLAYKPSGWNSMARRIKGYCAEEGVAFRQHRLRPTRTRQLHEADVPDSAIMELLGWKSPAMLRRYLGTIPLARLKRYPTTLHTVFGKAM